MSGAVATRGLTKPTIYDVRTRVRAYDRHAVPALNPAGQLPFPFVPGNYLQVTQLQVDYSGPAYPLYFGYAIKPAGVIELMRPAGAGLISLYQPDGVTLIWRNFNTLMLSAPECATKTRLTFNFTLSILIPSPGTYPDITGVNRTINIGTFDTWKWIIDSTKAAAAGKTGSAMFDAAYIMRSDTDANVGNIQAVPTLTWMDVLYAKQV